MSIQLTMNTKLIRIILIIFIVLAFYFLIKVFIIGNPFIGNKFEKSALFFIASILIVMIGYITKRGKK